MLNSTINLVINYIKEHYPEIRTQDGPFYDLYVKAFSLLFHGTITDIEDEFQEDLDLRNYATMSEEALDRVAEHNFITRNDGSKATTTVKVYLSSASAVPLPSGSVFSTTDGLRFLSTRDISFSSAQIAGSQEGNYFTFQVPVEAEEEGEEYNVSAGAITSIVSAFYAPVVMVTNESAAVGGANRETNTELYMRLVRSVNTRNLLITRGSVITVVGDNFPTVRRVTVAGMGDDMMQRDRIYSSEMPGGLSPYERQDFWCKRKGIIRFNKNIAREGRCDSLTLGTVEEVENTVVEVDQEDYYDLYARDLEYCTTRAGLEFSDDFELDDSAPISGGRVQDIDDWIATDSGFEFGQRKYGNSISLFNGYLCLGVTPEFFIEVGD